MTEVMDEPTLVFLDVETTGLWPLGGDRICEIGLVRARGEVILETYQSLVNPGRPLSPQAAAVNGLRDEDLVTAPHFMEIAELVQTRLAQAIVVCHNAPFDLSFLESEFSRLDQDWRPAGVIDTLEIARRFFDFPSNSLPALAERLQLETAQVHRALGDALATFQLFQYLYRQLRKTRDLQIGDLIKPYDFCPEAFLPPELQKALAEQTPVIITYLDSQGQQTNRMIQPLRLQVSYGIVYLVAHCYLRGAERNFRIDRILSIR